MKITYVISKVGDRFSIGYHKEGMDRSDDPYAIFECGTLSEAGSYKMYQSLSSPGATCLTINASDVTLDCNGFNIDGDDTSTGIWVYSGTNGVYLDNVTVKNCNIIDFSTGSYIFYVNNSTNISVCKY